MDPNSSSNQSQDDTTPTEDTQSVQAPLSTDPNNQSDSTTSNEPTSEAPVAQSNPADPQTTDDQQATATSDVPEPENYIENVGGDEIGLLDEISTNDQLLQEVADEMQLDTEKVKSILSTLLDKIDQGQITTEEIALILASTVADELTNDEEIL